MMVFGLWMALVPIFAAQSKHPIRTSKLQTGFALRLATRGFMAQLDQSICAFDNGILLFVFMTLENAATFSISFKIEFDESSQVRTTAAKPEDAYTPGEDCSDAKAFLGFPILSPCVWQLIISNQLRQMSRLNVHRQQQQE